MMKRYNTQWRALWYVLIPVGVFLSASVTHAQVATLISDGLGLESGDLGAYLNNLFDLALLVGAILAVLVIASAGLQYMTTDAVYGKTESRRRIMHAVAGLLMLLGIWLFFNTINPNILKLDFELKKVNTQGTKPPQPKQPAVVSPAERARQLKEEGERFNDTNPESGFSGGP